MVPEGQRRVMVEGLTIARVDAIGVVRFERPHERNAITPEMLAALPAALRDAVDDGARAVVLTGTSDAFSAGVALSAVRGDATDAALDELIGGAVSALHELDVPVIAAIEGACAGAAVELALSCDVRVAGADAFFLLPAARLGLLYRIDGVRALIQQAGPQLAARLLMLGERIPAGDAAASGLLAKVVATGTALSEAIAMAQRSAEAPAEIVALTRRMLAAVADGSIHTADWERRRLELLSSTERRDAIQAAKERLNIQTSDGEG